MAKYTTSEIKNLMKIYRSETKTGLVKYETRKVGNIKNLIGITDLSFTIGKSQKDFIEMHEDIQELIVIAGSKFLPENCKIDTLYNALPWTDKQLKSIKTKVGDIKNEQIEKEKEELAKERDPNSFLSKVYEMKTTLFYEDGGTEGVGKQNDRRFEIILGFFGDISVEDLNYHKIMEFREVLNKLPKQTLAPYNKMNVEEYLATADYEIDDGAENEIPANKRLSSQTKDHFIGLLVGILKQYEEINHHWNRPTAKRYKITDKLEKLAFTEDDIKILKKPITAEELALMPSASQADVDNNFHVKLIELYGYTSMRKQEATHMKLDVINDVKCIVLDKKEIKAKGKHLKNDTSYRTIPIHKDLESNISDYKKFIDKSSIHSLATKFHELIRLRGYGSEYSLHSLRKFTATSLDEADVKDSTCKTILGHVQKDVLNRNYIFKNIKMLKKAIDNIPTI